MRLFEEEALLPTVDDEDDDDTTGTTGFVELASVFCMDGGKEDNKIRKISRKMDDE